jgi:hypothetical protein
MEKKRRRKVFIIGEDDIESAKESLREALESFLEECEEMGTLQEVLEDAGFVKSSPKRVPVTHIRTNMRTAGMSRERYFQLLEKVK